MIFLIVFYRVLGGVAAITLVIYAILLFALVKLIPITLTLPGIAGMVLTLAVAADANIVIFERIKEEARAGRSIPAAISNGYAKALRTIVDANVVTIGVAFVLFTLVDRGREGLRVHAGHRHDRLAVHRGAGHLGDPRADGAHPDHRVALRHRRARERGLEVRLRREVEVVLLHLRDHPGDRRAGDRRQGDSVRHRLRLGHADQDAGRAQGRRGPGARRARAARPREREDPEGRRARSRAPTSSRSPPRPWSRGRWRR